MHSEFRKQLAASLEDVETSICAILAERDPQGKTAVCRLDRTGSTLDGWRQRTINQPVTAAASGRGTPKLPG